MQENVGGSTHIGAEQAKRRNGDRRREEVRETKNIKTNPFTPRNTSGRGGTYQKLQSGVSVYCKQMVYNMYVCMYDIYIYIYMYTYT